MPCLYINTFSSCGIKALTRSFPTTRIIHCILCVEDKRFLLTLQWDVVAVTFHSSAPERRPMEHTPSRGKQHIWTQLLPYLLWIARLNGAFHFFSLSRLNRNNGNWRITMKIYIQMHEDNLIWNISKTEAILRFLRWFAEKWLGCINTEYVYTDELKCR